MHLYVSIGSSCCYSFIFPTCCFNHPFVSFILPLLLLFDCVLYVFTRYVRPSPVLSDCIACYYLYSSHYFILQFILYFERSQIFFIQTVLARSSELFYSLLLLGPRLHPYFVSSLLFLALSLFLSFSGRAYYPKGSLLYSAFLPSIAPL